jgi:hypothetical protein
MLALTSILGLPAHPLLAHVPVVLVPLCAVGAVLMCWPRLRRSIGWWICGLLVVTGIATQLAISTGQDLKEYVRETALMHDHTRMGENIRPWLLLMFLALVGVMLVDRAVSHRSAAAGDGAEGEGARRADDRGARGLRIAGVVLSALAIVFSAMSVYWIYRIGHSGSKAVWQPTQVKIDAGASHGGEHDDG